MSQGLKNLLCAKSRYEFREWLRNNHDVEQECWLLVKRGSPYDDSKIFWYIDAVEEALCFGWIDSIHKNVEGVGHVQKFGVRKSNIWSELNKERVRRLEKLGLMTDAGRAILPDMDISHFKILTTLEKEMKETEGVWDNYLKFPPLYQRVRVDSVQREYSKPDVYARMKKNFFEHTRRGEMYGQWNDNGRLLDY